MKKIFEKALVLVQKFGMTVAAAVAVVLMSVPAHATTSEDVASLFTEATTGITGVQALFLALIVGFIGLSVISLAYTYVTKGIKKGKGAI